MIYETKKQRLDRHHVVDENRRSEQNNKHVGDVLTDIQKLENKIIDMQCNMYYLNSSILDLLQEKRKTYNVIDALCALLKPPGGLNPRQG